MGGKNAAQSSKSGAKKMHELVYKKNKEVIHRIVAGESVIIMPNYKLGEDVVFTLNDTATFIWNKVNGKHNCREIIEQLVNEFNIVEQKASKDVFETILNMEKLKLIHR